MYVGRSPGELANPPRAGDFPAAMCSSSESNSEVPGVTGPSGRIGSCWPMPSIVDVSSL